MVHVVHFDAVEPGGGQVGDRGLRHGPAALGGGRVREHGHAARGLDEADRLEGVGLVLGDVGPAAVGQPVPREGVGDAVHDPQLDQGGGDVRSPDGSFARDARDLLPGDRHTELLELGDHGPGARHAVVAHQLALGEQPGLLGVEEVGQHVHADAVEAAGEFGARDEGEPLGQRGQRLRVPAGRVVIGQRDDVKTGGAMLRTSSAGVSVPSDAVEWVCRSMRTTRTPGDDGVAGDAQA